MRPIALTGGIGSGKSTVAELLRRRGAFVVDADQLARQVVAPGTPGFEAVVAIFGPTVVAPGGGLDRAVLATRVFGSPADLQALEEITHPLVSEAARSAFREAPPGALLVYEIPLLNEASVRTWAAVVLIDASDDTRLARLTLRGMSEDDARSRMAAQVPRAERRKIADHVIDNDGSEADLEAEIDRLWPTLLALA
jgi:dephospho-CoA kinase